ncbi:MAG TPA: HsdR family type I site-specific deoxyribonuclease, partial [Chitinophagales bacterium]|nr:HsdR family type I site-specific deoxyribonuclease [Chitinophagales bacterium]
MAEYQNVEQPFLQKLRELGWQVIDQGPGVPQDPAKSLRNNFREVVLEDVFKESICNINRTPDGTTWLTDAQLHQLFLDATRFPGLNLLEANQAVHRMLVKTTSVERNEITGERSPSVSFIDFHHPERNSFIAINQFRLLTPGGPREGIIPDIVLFVNGLPLVVIECKDFDVSEPLSNAFTQVKRYSNQRDDDYGVQEGDERLFHFNAFSIITRGSEARFGSVTGEFDHYLNWKDIFPEEYRTVQVSPEEQRQEVLICGMLNHVILLDVLKNFTVFMQVSGSTVKAICRYQQYRAVGKIIDRLRNGQNPRERGGVVWHTQGSGKSLTMAFLVKKLRSLDDLRDYKVVIVVDRNDLEEQLSETAALAGEPLNVVEHRRDLQPQLSTSNSDLNMVMVHKFFEEEVRHSPALRRALLEDSVVPQFKPFEIVNRSERILLLIDEAHRTQGGAMGENMTQFAFPNAVKIGFTGTPLLTERHAIKTEDRFGTSIDTYKMDQSVKDKATLDIVYIGRTGKTQLADKDAFEAEFDDMFRNRTDEEIEEIKKRYGGMREYLESKPRIEKIAEDIVEHYCREILVNGFKAQVVGTSIVAAVRYKYEIEKALQRRIEREKQKPDGERDDALVKQMEFVKVAAVVTMLDNNEPGYISQARQQAKELNAVSSFKKDFDFDKPETGVAILCVCDRLITGFDAPIEQVMYLDKNLREHDLLQAITRVNRTKGPIKQYGIVMDYFGVTKNLKEALAIYTDKDNQAFNDLALNFRDINMELPVLEARYRRLLDLFRDRGFTDIGAFVTQRLTDGKAETELAETCIELAADVKFRAEFDTFTKSFFASLDLLFNVSAAKEYWIPAQRFGYLLMRMRNRYKDETLDLKWAGEKVRKLIDKHLISTGIDSKIPPVSLLSDDFPKEIDKYTGNPRAKASEMEHAIRRHIKVNLEKDPELFRRFHQKLEELIKGHRDHWDALAVELGKLRDEMRTGRVDNEIDGILKHEAPFYELIVRESF